jgi:hypothetical protein
MNGKTRYLGNIFIDRLQRSLKYECVDLHAWETGSRAKAGGGRWITFYNHLRPHARPSRTNARRDLLQLRRINALIFNERFEDIPNNEDSPNNRACKANSRRPKAIHGCITVSRQTIHKAPQTAERSRSAT